MEKIPAAPPPYPVGYEEVETVLVEGTSNALMMAIVGYFAPNRNRDIREIYGQTGDGHQNPGAHTFSWNDRNRRKLAIIYNRTFWNAVQLPRSQYIPDGRTIRESKGH